LACWVWVNPIRPTQTDTIINLVETYNPNTTRLNKQVMLTRHDSNFLKIFPKQNCVYFYVFLVMNFVHMILSLLWWKVLKFMFSLYRSQDQLEMSIYRHYRVGEEQYEMNLRFQFYTFTIYIYIYISE